MRSQDDGVLPSEGLKAGECFEGLRGRIYDRWIRIMLGELKRDIEREERRREKKKREKKRRR